MSAPPNKPDPRVSSSSTSPFPPQQVLPPHMFPNPRNSSPFRMPEPIIVPHKVDERCFTFCQQRASTRLLGAEPVCRTLCWRRVMEHEQKAAQARRGELPREVFFAVSIPGPPPKNLPPPNSSDPRRFSGPGMHQGPQGDFPEDIEPPPPTPIGTDLFPRVPTNAWTLPFLKGRYLYYARGPARASERMHSMRDIGLGEGWEEGARDGREEEVRAVGLKEIEAISRGGAVRKVEEEEWDPDYAILISLELIPPAVQSAVQGYFNRIYQPVTNAFSRYKDSFTSGHQQRTAHALWEKAWDTKEGAVGTLKKVGEAREKKKKELEQERERRQKESGSR